MRHIAHHHSSGILLRRRELDKTNLSLKHSSGLDDVIPISSPDPLDGIVKSPEEEGHNRWMSINFHPNIVTDEV